MDTANLHRSFWELIRDPYVRSGLYLWLMIAGLCVLVANGLGTGI